MPIYICLEGIPQLEFIVQPYLSDIKSLIELTRCCLWGPFRFLHCFCANPNQSLTLPLVLTIHTSPTLESNVIVAAE